MGRSSAGLGPRRTGVGAAGFPRDCSSPVVWMGRRWPAKTTWLAPPADPEFPPLLDENGKAFVTSGDCGDDQKCRLWVQSMGLYRRLLAKTFARRYRLSA